MDLASGPRGKKAENDQNLTVENDQTLNQLKRFRNFRGARKNRRYLCSSALTQLRKKGCGCQFFIRVYLQQTRPLGFPRDRREDLSALLWKVANCSKNLRSILFA
jgi:hypothetical protein